MDEALKTVIIDGDDEVLLELIMSDDGWDTISMRVGKVTYRADWLGNLKPFFERAIELWKENS